MDVAFDCAKLMIKIAPFLAGGYSRLATLYKMQGKANTELEVLDKAMENKPDAGGAGWSEIIRARDEAIARINRRVDFLSRIPLDLVMIVLNNLTLEDKLACVAVSRSWRGLLESSGSLGLSLHLDGSLKHLNNLELMANIPNELRLTAFNDNQLRRFFSYPVAFENLKALKLTNCDGITPKTAGTVFAKMPCLTELEIQLNRPVIPLVDLLCVCKKLKTLIYAHQCDIWMSPTHDMVLPNTLELGTLAIMHRAPDQLQIQKIMERSPCLEKLYLDHVMDFSMLDKVETCCPNIKVLVVNDRNGRYPPSRYFGDAANIGHPPRLHHPSVQFHIPSVSTRRAEWRSQFNACGVPPISTKLRRDYCRFHPALSLALKGGISPMSHLGRP
ncbi:hypothetical protein BX666DRAFT_133295 [Dichotomocladium elegans]|nr:hypothetical protein BX666DRAFT_133295 [Dichotomocladium elegans]